MVLRLQSLFFHPPPDCAWLFRGSIQSLNYWFGKRETESTWSLYFGHDGKSTSSNMSRANVKGVVSEIGVLSSKRGRGLKNRAKGGTARHWTIPLIRVENWVRIGIAKALGMIWRRSQWVMWQSRRKLFYWRPFVQLRHVIQVDSIWSFVPLRPIRTNYTSSMKALTRNGFIYFISQTDKPWNLIF